MKKIYHMSEYNLGIAYFSPLEAIRFILFLAGQVKNK